MASSANDKTVVISLLKEKKADLDAIVTQLAGVAALDPATSDDAAIQAVVDAYEGVRTSRSTYGNISLPSLDSSEAFAAVAAGVAE